MYKKSREVIHNGTSTQEEIEKYNTINFICNLNLWQYISWEFLFSTKKVTKKLKSWLDYQRKRNPEMRYLIIPELHKSGRIHFHGVFSDVKNWSLSPAINPYTGESIIENNKQVYNLDNYKLGYTTVSKVENIEAVSHYISKYITKELLNLKNKKNVWHSRNLIKPQMTYHLANLSDISNYIDSNNYNIDYKSEKAQENYEKRYYSVSSYNIYYVNFSLLSLFFF